MKKLKLLKSCLDLLKERKNRLSGFDGLFYFHMLSNKNRYLQHFTTGLVGIIVAIAQAATAAEINNKRVILQLTLIATGIATSAKHFIIKKRTEEIRLSSTSTNAINLSRHFR